MQDLAKSSPATPAGAAMVKAERQRWPGLFKQLQMWSSVIDFTRVPGNDRQATQAMIDSIEHAALRLDAAEHARRQPVGTMVESLQAPLRRLHDACVESFQLIANALAELKPAPPLPETGALVREIESRGGDLRRAAGGDDDTEASVLRVMGVAANLHSLAGAIQDCRDRTNAIDWTAWNRNYL
jgi:hypothetical protein